MPPKANVTLKEGYLYAINVFYFIVAIIIIAVAGVAKGQAYISTIGIIGGIIAVGVFLLIISILGAFGAWKKKRGVIFAYMILLALLFIIQFSVSIAVLAFNQTEQKALVEDGWCGLEDYDKNSLQSHFDCFGLYTDAQNPAIFSGNSGPTAKCMKPGSNCLNNCNVQPGYCTSPVSTVATTTTTVANATTPAATTAAATTSAILVNPCSGCYDALQGQIADALRTAGGVGLGFAFTEILGIIAAFFFWRQSKAGDANYRAFL
jgi:tetraspanin-13/31